MIAFLALLASNSVQPPLPPYRRTATAQVFASAYEPEAVVVGNTFISASGDQCVAFDLVSFRRLWVAKAPKGERFDRIAADRNGVFANTHTGTSAHLVSLDLAKGAQRWIISSEAGESALALSATQVFVGLTPGALSAVDRRTHRKLWSTQLTKASKSTRSDDYVQAVTSTDGGVVVNISNSTYGLNPANGNVRWTEPGANMYHDQFAVGQGVVGVPNGLGIVGREVAMGKRVWKSSKVQYGEFSGALNGAIVWFGEGTLQAISARSGKDLWSRSGLGPKGTSGGNQYGSVLGDKIFVRGIKRAAIFDAQGNQLWGGDSDAAYPAPCWTDGRALVAFDGTRLIKYVAGKEEAFPSDSAGRQSLAAKLVARFSDLDDAEVARLKSLGDDAFPFLLSAYVRICNEYADAENAKRDTYPLYSQFHVVGEVLSKVTTAKRSRELMSTLDKLNGPHPAKPLLLTLLAQFGDPSVATRYFLREIENVRTPGFEMYESSTYVARTYISTSSDPRAVAFKLKQLRDPKADVTMRTEAYYSLAGTGGAEGLRAVLEERHRRELLRSIDLRVTTGYLNAGEMGARTRVVAEKTDTDGRHWGLLESGAIGNYHDLWLAEKVDGQWVHPYFTAMSNGQSGRRRPDDKTSESTFEGKKVSELVAGAWFSTFVPNKAIRKDTDGDGLTDLVEARLGTDPKKADTDGDGDPDGVDPWPNAAPRELSDAEKVIAAAFEARYHFDQSEGADIFQAPEGCKPFELVGRRGPTLWAEASPKKPEFAQLMACYETGVGMIGVHGGNRQKKGAKWEESVITWNKDHTEASFVISTYFGGLNGTGFDVHVRKFGDEWVVVSMRMAYVS